MVLVYNDKTQKPNGNIPNFKDKNIIKKTEESKELWQLNKTDKLKEIAAKITDHIYNMMWSEIVFSDTIKNHIQINVKNSNVNKYINQDVLIPKNTIGKRVDNRVTLRVRLSKPKYLVFILNARYEIMNITIKQIVTDDTDVDAYKLLFINIATIWETKTSKIIKKSDLLKELFLISVKQACENPGFLKKKNSEEPFITIK